MSTQSARKTEAFGCRQPWRALGAYRGAGESGGGETKRAGGGGEGQRQRAGEGEAVRAGRRGGEGCLPPSPSTDWGMGIRFHETRSSVGVATVWAGLSTWAKWQWTKPKKQCKTIRNKI